jgi:hypothetical protein
MLSGFSHMLTSGESEKVINLDKFKFTIYSLLASLREKKFYII